MKLHVVETGGDAYQQAREQWDDGNNIVALEPGVVVAYERNTFTISKMREAGVEVVTIEASSWARVEAGHCMTCPVVRDLPGGVCNGLRCRRPLDRRDSDRGRDLALVALARGEPERTPRAVSQPLAAELRT